MSASDSPLADAPDVSHRFKSYQQQAKDFHLNNLSSSSSSPQQTDTPPCHNTDPTKQYVSLRDADKELLEKEVEYIIASLQHPDPWVLPDNSELINAGGDDHGEEDKANKLKGIPRPSDQAYGIQHDENIPGTEDLHAEMHNYTRTMTANAVLDMKQAQDGQVKTYAKDLDLLPLDPMDEIDTIPIRVDFINKLYREVKGGGGGGEKNKKLEVAVVATIADGILGMRRNILPWLQYHVELGISKFYLLYDGKDKEVVGVLGSIQCVELMHVHEPWSKEKDRVMFEVYKEQAAKSLQLSQWSDKPGNYELMVKQGYAEQTALSRSKLSGIDWLMHIDPDELFYPGGCPVMSVTAVLGKIPPHVPGVRFMNYEGQPEIGDAVNRIEQVTLFRAHKHFITPEALWYRSTFKLGENAAFLMLYANGKSAVRVNAAGVHHLGPHFFSGSPSLRWQTADNPTGHWVNLVSDDAIILHYAYSYLSDVANKAHRSCPDEYLEAAKHGDVSKVGECFVIEFDRDAYMAAAHGKQEEFFWSRMVLSEGSLVQCDVPGDKKVNTETGEVEMVGKRPGWCNLHDVNRFKFLMEKLGLYKRVLAPQAVLRQHERAIQRVIKDLQEEAMLLEQAVHLQSQKV
jgi:hypothetical protein